MQRHRFNLLLLLLSGSIALLLARVVALLFDADRSQPFVQLLLRVTAPLLALVAWIDRGQPTAGVRFERGTLLLAGALLLARALLAWRHHTKELPND